jgi:hypothetical protein
MAGKTEYYLAVMCDKEADPKVMRLGRAPAGLQAQLTDVVLDDEVCIRHPYADAGIELDSEIRERKTSRKPVASFCHPRSVIFTLGESRSRVRGEERARKRAERLFTGK